MTTGSRVTDDRAVPQVVGSAHTVPDAATIERELTAAWRAAATDSVTHGGAPVLRTSTGTVVALVGPQDDAEAVQDTLVAATATQPSRLLLVTLDPAGDAHIEARYSVFCQMPMAGRRHVCNEIIRIDAAGDGVHNVAPLVLGLLEPNLPVTVWAADRHQWELPQMATVFHVADRLVLESRDRDGLRALRMWEKARARFGSPRVHVVDMAWQRLYAWRVICAELFDGLVERHDLERVDAVEILLPPPEIGTRRADGGVFASPVKPVEQRPEPGPSALLLAGWLSSRLGWRVTGSSAPGTVRLARESQGSDTGSDAPAIELRFGVAELLSCPSGWPLHSVSLTVSAPRAAAYSVRVHPDGTSLMASVGVTAACPVPQCVPARALARSELVGAALAPQSPDRVYDEALAAAVEIAAALDRA